jgi:hypothetical protein
VEHVGQDEKGQRQDVDVDPAREGGREGKRAGGREGGRAGKIQASPLSLTSKDGSRPGRRWL